MGQQKWPRLRTSCGFDFCLGFSVLNSHWVSNWIRRVFFVPECKGIKSFSCDQPCRGKGGDVRAPSVGQGSV